MSSIIIIGAGPIGSYAALKLASAGHIVTVIDKKNALDNNICCTGIVSIDCYDHIKKYLTDDVLIRKANAATFFSPCGKSLELSRNQDTAVILNRPLLNVILANIAQKYNVKYLLSSMATAIHAGEKHAEVTVRRDEKYFKLTADIIILATGYTINLLPNLKLGTISHFNFGCQAQVTIRDISEVEIYLDHKLAPGGFSWLVPTQNNRGLAGLITNTNPKQNLNNLILFLRQQGKIKIENYQTKFGLLPLQPLPKTYGNRILILGEAAGQIKPITGGGIYYGVLCADIAVSIIEQAATLNDYSEKILSLYQKQWHNKLLKEIKLSYYAYNMWAQLPDRFNNYLIDILNKKHIPEMIKTMNTFQFDRHTSLIINTAIHLLSFANIKEKL